MADRLLIGSNVPLQFRRARFRHYDTDLGSIAALKSLESWLPTETKPNVLLVGRPNRAKTMMAAALLNEYQIREVPKTPNTTPDLMSVIRQNKVPVYFIQLAALIKLHLRRMRLEDRVKAGTEDPAEYLEIDRLIEDLDKRVKMLVLDDVGKEHRTASGFAEDEFDYLVRTRTNAALPTIFTSNVPLSQWSAQYSDSMQSLIRRTSLIVRFS